MARERSDSGSLHIISRPISSHLISSRRGVVSNQPPPSLLHLALPTNCALSSLDPVSFVIMALEETVKSMAALSVDDQTGSFPNSNPKGSGGPEPEEGEIVGEEQSLEPPVASPYQTHPLEHAWTFWFDNPSAKSKQAAWGASIRPIYTFSTVEEFWSIYNNIHHPGKLAHGADFYCFKDNIEPKWEDPVCANGGKWTLNFNRGKSDTPWLYTLLAMIGEQFEHGDEICGAVVNVRGRQEKVSLWTKNASNEAAQISIGKQWKEFVDNNETIGFIFHDHAEKLGKSAKNSYTV